MKASILFNGKLIQTEMHSETLITRLQAQQEFNLKRMSFFKMNISWIWWKAINDKIWNKRLNLQWIIGKTKVNNNTMDIDDGLVKDQCW